MLSLVSCSDWTETEALDSTVKKPWEQDPALWAEYTATLRAYKQSEHFIVYARMHNSPEKATGEQDFMRCLPDSLDIVTLTNADNFSKFDAEDMSVMHEKGTKVLYQIDYAARAEEFADAAALDAYLDKVVVAVAANGMDGYSFTTDPLAADATARIIDRLCHGQETTVSSSFSRVIPLSLAATDRAKMDYVILDTEKLENVLDVRLHAPHAVNYAGIEANRLLLTAEINAALFDEDRTEARRRRRNVAPRRRTRALCGACGLQYCRRLLPFRDEHQTIRQAIQNVEPL